MKGKTLEELNELLIMSTRGCGTFFRTQLILKEIIKRYDEQK